MKEVEPDLLEMMKRHELAIMQLYEVFDATFANNKGLWQELAGDEQKHATWIERLSSNPAVEKWLLQNVLVKRNAIKLSIDYAESQAKKARDGTLTQMQALSTARDLENALIEKQFSRLNNSSSHDFNSIMEALSRETEKHRNRIIEAINAEKQ